MLLPLPTFLCVSVQVYASALGKEGPASLGTGLRREPAGTEGLVCMVVVVGATGGGGEGER